MNEREAIKILEMFLHKQCDLGRTEFAYNQNEIWAAVKMASKALEKQVTKGAKLLDRFYDEVRSCPSCGNITGYDGKEFFCKKCGQKLKWSNDL